MTRNEDQTGEKTGPVERRGAGRPRGENHFGVATFCMPKDVAEVLKRQKNRSAFIIKCIRAYISSHPDLI